jgi:deoxyribodipyrimidine photo-lyase
MACSGRSRRHPCIIRAHSRHRDQRCWIINGMSNAQVVWFKRDLRTHDHVPLREAAARGPVLPLYIVEPEYWQGADASGRHWEVVRESLVELREALHAIGLPLIIRQGDAVNVLDALRREQNIAALWSHEETGNAFTFARDKRVAGWAKAHAVLWTEIPQFGVVRRLKQRGGWVKHWEAHMNQPVQALPSTIEAVQQCATENLPSAQELGLKEDSCPHRQRGGRKLALKYLNSFFAERGVSYHYQMSSPNTAPQACSRLSVPLSVGAISMREVLQRTAYERGRARNSERYRAFTAFEARLHWHCHFIQKFESEPELEYQNMNRGFDGMREDQFNREYFNAWASGQTGLPFVDACMRRLQATGWINFRMRAMLVSVASYHLWLHWPPVAQHLARLFTDYEPGIHYPQIQMQSGTTGINIPRIYNPIKQSQEQDPRGEFIRYWLPELRRLPNDMLHAPWLMDTDSLKRYAVTLGENYPMPIIEPEQAARDAKAKYTQWRQRDETRALSKAVLNRHGSRRKNRQAFHASKQDAMQTDLFG